MKLVITGDTETGKSTLAHILKCQFPNQISLVPDPLDLFKNSPFPKASTFLGLKSQQKALYYLHKELEVLVSESQANSLTICDHGTLDCLENWPDSAQSFFEELHTDLKTELERYNFVIQITRHRLESAQFSVSTHLDPQDFWSFHPRRYVISAELSYSECIQKACEIIREILKNSYLLREGPYGSPSLDI